jgi:flagella basal body P-ring formation protein FlgA
MMGVLRFALGMTLSVISLMTMAQADWRSQVQQFLSAHPELQGGQVKLEWPRKVASLPPCARPLSIQLAPASKLQGWTALAVACAEPGKNWERRVQVRLLVQQRYLAASRNLMPGHLLTADDLVWAEGDAAHLGTKLAQDLDSVMGQELRRPLTQGSPLRLNTLRPVTVMKKGSQIVLVLRGAGFAIEANGQALNDSPLGGTVQVMIKEGTIVSAKVISAGLAEAQ